MGRNVKVDYSELDNFRKDVEKSLGDKELELFIESCAKELTARLLAKVIKRTPVGKPPKLKSPKSVKVTGASGKKRSFLSADAVRHQKYWSGYVGGTLRRGWTGGKDVDAATYTNTLKVHHYGNTYTIEVVNPVEYASYVEHGHRQTPGRYVPALGRRLKKGWVEGEHMLEDSSKEVQRDAPRVLKAKLKNKLGECFK
jgi:hypothetical protein